MSRAGRAPRCIAEGIDTNTSIASGPLLVADGGHLVQDQGALIAADALRQLS